MSILIFLYKHIALYYTWVVILSLLVGSFLNVVIYRLPIMIEQETMQERAKFNLSMPDSHCPLCHHKLAWWQNIPIISFIFLRAKCTYCKGAISWRYPLVELLTMLLSIFVAYQLGPSWQAIYAILATWILITISAIDLDTLYVPDVLVYLLLWLGLFANIFGFYTSSANSIIGAIVGYVSFYIIAKLYYMATKKEGLGHGDFKLLAASGAWLGWFMIPLMLLLSGMLCLIYACFIIARKKTIKGQPIPFGPSLALAFWLLLIFRLAIFRWWLG